MPKKIVDKTSQTGQKQAAASGKQDFTSEEATPAQILEFISSMGTREGGRQVRVKLLSGPEAGKIMRRNVLGPFRIGDIILLRETEIDASPAKGRKR